MGNAHTYHDNPDASESVVARPATQLDSVRVYFTSIPTLVHIGAPVSNFPNFQSFPHLQQTCPWLAVGMLRRAGRRLQPKPHARYWWIVKIWVPVRLPPGFSHALRPRMPRFMPDATWIPPFIRRLLVRLGLRQHRRPGRAGRRHGRLRPNLGAVLLNAVWIMLLFVQVKQILVHVWDLLRDRSGYIR
uniref:Uncharacterized protein n=1 Tax=Anopheles farauti TaxID=69004 RepID=A0A182QB61_9DIPT